MVIETGPARPDTGRRPARPADNSPGEAAGRVLGTPRSRTGAARQLSQSPQTREWIDGGSARRRALQKHFRLPKIGLSANFSGHESLRRRATRTTLQAVMFGMMLSWTPSVVLLAWFLWKDGIGIDDI